MGISYSYLRTGRALKSGLNKPLLFLPEQKMQRSVMTGFENATVGKKSIRVIIKREKRAEKGCFHGEKRRHFQYADTYLKSRNTKKPCAKPLSEHRKRTAVAIHIVSQLRFLFGRGDRTRTCGILLPKQARYHLRYTSIFLYQLFSYISVFFPALSALLRFP